MSNRRKKGPTPRRSTAQAPPPHPSDVGDDHEPDPIRPADLAPVELGAMQGYLAEVNAAGITNADRLEIITMMRGTLDAHARQVVGWARAEGMSWSKVGAHLGISKQAAQQRFGASTR